MPDQGPYVLIFDALPQPEEGQNRGGLWWEGSGWKKAARAAAKHSAEKSLRAEPYFVDKPCLVIVSLGIPFGRKYRYDVANIGGLTKALIDGLTDAKLWKDDAIIGEIRYSKTTLNDAWLAEYPRGVTIVEIFPDWLECRAEFVFTGDPDGEANFSDSSDQNAREDG